MHALHIFSCALHVVHEVKTMVLVNFEDLWKTNQKRHYLFPSWLKAMYQIGLSEVRIADPDDLIKIIYHFVNFQRPSVDISEYFRYEDEIKLIRMLL